MSQEAVEDLKERTVSVKEAAEIAGVHIDTIYRWIYTEILNPMRSKTGRYRILPDDLAEAIGKPNRR